MKADHAPAFVVAEGKYGLVGHTAIAVRGSNRRSESSPNYLASGEVVADERITRSRAMSSSFC